MSYQIFSAETTNATSGTVKSHKPRHTVFCWGTFGGATVKLQASPDGVEWFDVAALTFTAKGEATVELGEGVRLRGVISGGTGASLNLTVV